MSCITRHTFKFFRALALNNNRIWFEEHRAAYQRSHEEALCFVEKLKGAMAAYDVIEPRSSKKSIYRIYRDIRFSHDKTPYKTYWGGYLKRAGAERRGGMAFHIEPGNSFIAGGFWGPNKEDLLLLRHQIAGDALPLRDVLSDNAFQEFFGALEGKKLKVAPKGFDKAHPDIDLLNHKQFIIKHSYSDKDVLSPNFEEQMAEGFSRMLPFFDVMTEYLTTDLNGESVL